MENFVREVNQSVWYYTKLPDDIIKSIEEDVKKYNLETHDATVGNLHDVGEIVKERRDSSVCFIPEFNWLVGFCYHYILHANASNFNYELHGFDQNQMQYTEYGPGQFYNWHSDEDRSLYKEEVRKLSFTLQLSDPDEYEGGEFQILNWQDRLYRAPKEKGTIIIFDSLSRHRVTKVKSGMRKSLVGWVKGPRWK